MKKEQAELEARSILRVLGDPYFLDKLPLDVRGKLILKMSWEDGKTLTEIATHFSLSRERVRQLIQKQIWKLRNFVNTANEEHIKYEQMKNQYDDLKSTVEAYRVRFESLQTSKEKEKKVESGNDTKKSKPTKEDFGDIKLLKIKTEELGLPEGLTWSLIYHGQKNVADLLKANVKGLMKQGCKSKQILLIQEALAKHKLSLKE